MFSSMVFNVQNKNSFIMRNFYFDSLLYFFFKKKKKKFFEKTTLCNRYSNLFSDTIRYKFKNNDILFQFNYNNFILRIFLIRFTITLKYYNEILDDFIRLIPNYLDNSVLQIPANYNYSIIKESIQYKKEFDFSPKEHFKLFPNYCDIISLTTSLKISGTRFSTFAGNIAKLHRILGQFMLDLHIRKHMYTEVYVPMLVKENSLINSGQLPKFYYDQYKIVGEDLWLIPTGEVSLVNLVSNSTLIPTLLPLKFVCLSSCFRKETGNYGKDIKGIFRQHQFEKVELVQIVHPDKSNLLLDILVEEASFVLDCLKIPYRVILLNGNDTGFTSIKTYDIETWLPGKNAFQEVSSCSNTADFQAKRMNVKFFQTVNKKSLQQYVHILNGSGLAIGRTLIAILENYQDSHGNIIIPDILIPYMGIDKIFYK